MTKLVPALLAMLSFTGCTLIDQNTFKPSPEAKAAPAPAPPPQPMRLDPRKPLVTIDYTEPSPDYADLLHYAVRAAETRSPDVQYDVVAVVKDPANMPQAMDRATGVMRAIMRDRVPDSRIHIATRTDPGLPNDQVRVYVR